MPDNYSVIVMSAIDAGAGQEVGESMLIEMEGINKNFGRVEALRDVDFSLRENEIHGIVGDNGSGKSTLVKILVGVHQPASGQIRIHGEPAKISSPQDARDWGISTVFQDLALVDERSVADNMYLGRYPVKRIGGLLPIVDWDVMRSEAERILKERLNITINPKSRVEYLSGGERQSIAIGRALVTDPNIVVMDEPTSALSTDSAERVQELVRTMKSEGLSIVIISHNLDEVFGLTDRITVLDNGQAVGTVNTESVTRSDIVEMIVGGEVPEHIEEDSDF